MASMKGIMLSVLVFSAVAMAYNSMVGDLVSSYSLTPDTEFSNIFYRINQTSATAKDLADQLNNQITTQSTSIYQIVQGGYGALRIGLGFFGTITAMIMDLASNALGIPAWIVGVFLTGIILVMVFAVISIVFRLPYVF